MDSEKYITILEKTYINVILVTGYTSMIKIQCNWFFLEKLKDNTIFTLTQDELKHLSKLYSKPIKVKRGVQFVQEGQVVHKAFIMQDGWVYTYKILTNGSRQVISVAVPGDCAGLRNLVLRYSDQTISALTDALIYPIDRSLLLETFDRFPRLGAAILWAVFRDEAMVIEHLVSLGRRTAIERTAHFFLGLRERLGSVGLVTEGEFSCPLNQYLLADALGLSAVHVNRVLRQLRERNLMTFHAHRVTIHDLESLKKLARFHGDYLTAKTTS